MGGTTGLAGTKEIGRGNGDNSLRKCVETIKGASKEKVRKKMGVERMSTNLDGMQARFVARIQREKYLCGILWEGGFQRAPRITGTHEEFHTTMDYVAAKVLGPVGRYHPRGSGAEGRYTSPRPWCTGGRPSMGVGGGN